jgi:hypothetical protein
MVRDLDDFPAAPVRLGQIRPSAERLMPGAERPNFLEEDFGPASISCRERYQPTRDLTRSWPPTGNYVLHGDFQQASDDSHYSNRCLQRSRPFCGRRQSPEKQSRTGIRRLTERRIGAVLCRLVPGATVSNLDSPFLGPTHLGRNVDCRWRRCSGCVRSLLPVSWVRLTDVPTH